MIEAVGHLGAKVTFDGQTIAINRKGISFVGRGEQTITIRQLSAVDFMASGAVQRKGFLRLILAGTVAPPARPGLRLNDAYADRWAIVFQRKHEAEFEKLRDAIRASLAAQHQGDPVSAAPARTDIAEQLRKLDELRGSGALTEVEFAAAKQRILNP